MKDSKRIVRVLSVAMAVLMIVSVLSTLVVQVLYAF